MGFAAGRDERAGLQGKAGRVRWVAVFAALLLLISAVSVLAAEPVPASAPEDTAPPVAAEGPGLLEGLEAFEEEEEAEEAWLESAEATAQREESRTAFDDLGASEAKALLADAFAETLNQIEGDPARVISDLQIEDVIGTHSALVPDGEGGSQIVESPIPIADPRPGEQGEAIDLGLVESGGDLVAQAPAADIRLPDTLGGQIEIGSELAITALPGDPQVPASRFGDKDLFLANSGTDTDTFIAPLSAGVEVFEQLRSPQSPEQFRFGLSLPQGTTLRPDGSGGAEIVDSQERRVAFVPAPYAIDAQGSEVPVSMSVEGASLLLDIPHRSLETAYPLLLDPELVTEHWYWNGGNLFGLGTWRWSENADYENSTACIVAEACWNAGLYARSRGSNYWYGPNTWGQWIYEAPNTTAYISRTVFWTLHGSTHNCYTHYPYGFVGIWNVNTNTWNSRGIYSPPNFSSTSFDTGWSGGVGTRKAVVGVSTGASASQLACGHDFYVGGTTIYQDDPENPTVTSVTGVPGGWVSNANSFTITANVSDPGLGVYETTLTPRGRGTRNPRTGCTGTAASRCPSFHSQPFALNGADFDEGEKVVEVAAKDVTGRPSGTYTAMMKVDNTPPEVALSGQLASATREEGSDGADPAKWEELPLPVYDLTIAATDIGTFGDANERKRSGVEKIEVFLDNVKKQEWQEPCSTHSCPMTRTYQLRQTDLTSAGRHVLKVIARDRVGKAREREIEFEYVPATGMKDEYAMHYFPLSDGQGNEAEEEHPARPELAVNVMNGNLVYRERDFEVEGPAVDLEVERYYNSQLPTAENTEWGDGWTLAQTPDLDTGGTPSPGEAELLEASGAIRNRVQLPLATGSTQFDPSLQATVTRTASGYVLADETGESATSTYFDESGRTQALLTEGAAKVDYVYDGAGLTEIAVEDPGSAGNPTEAPAEEGGEPAQGPYTGVLYVRSFGSQGSGAGQLELPADVALDAQGNLWVIDRGNDRVQKFDPDGELLDQFGSPGTANGQFTWPSAIDIDPEGNIWVADSANHRIQKFDSQGNFLLKFGTFGTGNGQFNAPSGVAAGPAGLIFVTDRGNHRIQRFTKTGGYFGQAGSYGWEDLKFDEPTAISIGPASGSSPYTVYAVDGGNDRIKRYTPDGLFLYKFGTYGTGPGQLDSPAAIDVDSKGNVWVGDRRNSRVQLFDEAGSYIDHFGSNGTGEGQLGTAYPMGIAADEAGGIWVSDGENDRLQKWVAGSYVPDPGEELPEDDPAVDVTVSSGLVASVAGEEAGTHAYSYSGDDPTSHTGPQGQTKYEYDPAGRMTKVTLPNGTSASIAYNATYGRVASVTVDPAGSEPARTTEFQYSDQPRRTTVIIPGAPNVTYDIGADGSVLKWWNTPVPPSFNKLSGSLYTGRGTLIATGIHNLEVEAHSQEGIASVQIIANGNQLVDEATCTIGPENPCLTLVNEWVVETGSLAPGIMQLEVIATNHDEKTESERFWVNVPYTPPEPPGALTPPKFMDILRFREEHGLEVVFPVANELELNDRIFDLIGAWHNPQTPAGAVARASTERWGVPLRAADVAELDYRIAYWAHDAAAIEAWAGSNASNSFAGVYIDESAGGLMRVGFTQGQQGSVDLLVSSGGLVAPSRIRPFPVAPAHTVVALQSLQQQIASLATGSYPALITSARSDVHTNRVEVGASDVTQAINILNSHFGSNAPISVSYQPVKRPHRSGRERVTGAIRAGDLIRVQDGPNSPAKEKLVGEICTNAFGAFDKVKNHQTGRTQKVMFVLTASHCVEKGHEVIRRSDPSQVNKQWIGIVRRDGADTNPGTLEVDAAAVRLYQPAIVPRKIFTAEGSPLVPVQSVAVAPGVGTNICFSGVKSNELRCGPILGPPERVYIDGYLTAEICFEEFIEAGDSGSPAWIEGTGAAVGIMTSGFGQFENAPKEACFEALKPYPGWPSSTAVFTNSGMAPLHLVTNDG